MSICDSTFSDSSLTTFPALSVNITDNSKFSFSMSEALAEGYSTAYVNSIVPLALFVISDFLTNVYEDSKSHLHLTLRIPLSASLTFPFTMIYEFSGSFTLFWNSTLYHGSSGPPPSPTTAFGLICSRVKSLISL